MHLARLGVSYKTAQGNSDPCPSVHDPRLQIMAGVDQEFQGESRLSDWAKVGYLEQEPKLDDGPTVTSNIEAAVVATRTLLKEYEQVKFKWRREEKEVWTCLRFVVRQAWSRMEECEAV